MGQGGYIFCEWDSVVKQWSKYQEAFIKTEEEAIGLCEGKWAPKKCGYLTPNSGEFGRTTILPALFDDWLGVQMATWRQRFTATGHRTIITGTRAGNTIPEDFVVAWVGIALPNKNQHLTEIKFQIGDRKYGRIDLEEVHLYNKPAIIFEEGVVIDEETAFDLYGYIEGPLPQNGPGGLNSTVYQRIVLLGAAYYKQIDRVLGQTGAAI